MRFNKIKLHMHSNPASNRCVQVCSEPIPSSPRMGTLMGAVALLCTLVSMDANALALGRIMVQSTLGEPLRAEIDIAEINASEAASLQVKVASPDAFKAAGIEFTPVLSGMTISLQQRADGRSYLRLVGNRTVSEPFVDLIVEANWSAGRVSRDYTLLFDPPGFRSNSNVTQGAQTIPMVPRSSTASAAPPAAVAPARVTAPEQQTPRVPSSPAYNAPPVAIARPMTPPRAPVARPAAAAPNFKSNKVTVRAGDTAGKIAAKTKSGNVSLDQMLVALLRQNPEAFIGGNINRVKSGAVLQIPSPEAVSAMTVGDAAQTIVAQSDDFNAFRRKLAAGVPTTNVATADRQASGKVQAKVEDRAPTSTVPDKLTLSKGAIAGRPAASAEQQIATVRQDNDSASRVAELSKNISDLNKLSAASSAQVNGLRTPASGLSVPTTAPAAVNPAVVSASAATPMMVKPSAPVRIEPVVSAQSAVSSAASQVAASAVAASAATAAVQPASAAASNAANATVTAPAVSPASTPKVQASAAADTTVKSAPVAVAPAAVVKSAPTVDKPSVIGELMDNSLVLLGLALLVLLFAGFAFYRKRQSKQSTQVDSSFLESRLQPDSFFGASGGQRVDTNDGNATGSSLVYSPSQLDAAGDVDPVAEADVYLAYGRDLQAEEILKEALRTNPMRVAIHAKLLEIYAKRHDVKAFGVIAADAFKLTRGEGSEWHYISNMGRELDPGNTLYLPGGQPPLKPASSADAAHSGGSANSGGFGSSTLPQAIEPQLGESEASSNFDLDLDFSLDDSVAKPAVASQPADPVVPKPNTYTASGITAPEPMFSEIDMDFGDGKAVTSADIRAAHQKPDLDEPLSFDSIAFPGTSDFKPPLFTSSGTPASSKNANGPLEFDMGDLSLDLDGPITEVSPYSGKPALDDQLETKFSLAQEFSSLGDPEGARALVEEVLLEATGSLKIKAQSFLNALS